MLLRRRLRRLVLPGVLALVLLTANFLHFRSRLSKAEPQFFDAVRPVWNSPYSMPDEYTLPLCRCDYRATAPRWALPTSIQRGEFAGHEFRAAASLAGQVHFGQFEVILNLTRARPSWQSRTCRAVDVGANDGAITLALAAYGCFVRAFEALSVNAARVVGGVYLNDFTDRVRLVQGAVSDTCGVKLKIDLNTDGDQHNGQILAPGGYSADDARHGKKLKTEIISTLPLCAHLTGDAELLKVDIEGFEQLALRGARPWLERYRVPWIHAEFSPSNMKHVTGLEPVELLTELSQLGYRIFTADCFHNIVDAAVKALPAKCARSQADARAVIQRITDGTADEYEVKPEKAHGLVRTLLEHHSSMACCMLNLVAFRARDF